MYRAHFIPNQGMSSGETNSVFRRSHFPVTTHRNLASFVNERADVAVILNSMKIFIVLGSITEHSILQRFPIDPKAKPS